MKGFTLVEVIISSAIFLIGMFVLSQIYFSFIKSIIFAQNLQANIDNVRYGLEKIWNEVKSGSDFPTSTIATTTLTFKDRRCRAIEIYKNDQKLMMKIGSNPPQSIFDENLVLVDDFRVFFDKTDFPTDTNYYKSSKKLVVIEIKFNLKVGENIIPYSTRISIAPFKSPLGNVSPCYGL
ncbi:MAG: prepilin-type N-terminal cleavage/methylation domain-containing protein [Patescibacteria group bacterium]|nr:prepilin-type N-terminal cleavage/methylation domain-containing protein [Patescibacteria group bacterium]